MRLEAYHREKIQLQFPQLARAENIYNYSVLMESFVPPDISPQSYGHVLIPNVTSIRTTFQNENTNAKTNLKILRK